MHAIDTLGAVDGQFQEGNPSTGQRATKVGAAWLNDVQANLLAVLQEAGIEPEKGRELDLVEAIIAIANGVTGDGGGAVPTTRTVTGGGLVTGGGALSANRTLTVDKATGAEILAGAIDTKALTPAGMRAAMGATFGADKSVNLFGFIIKWGSVAGPFFEGPVYTPFPVAFPNECFIAFPIAVNPTASPFADATVERVSFDVNGMTTFAQFVGAGLGLGGFDYVAFGR